MNNRIALLVGIDHYESSEIQDLLCCENDAREIRQLLMKNGDKEQSCNFDCRLLLSSQSQGISRNELKDALETLFSKDVEVALFYYSGHGYSDNRGNVLVTSDCHRGDEGLNLSEVMTLIKDSPAKNKIIIIDSCFSGGAGNLSLFDEQTFLSKGAVILASSKDNEPSFEKNNHGVFTSLLIDSLNGAAANIAGEVSLGSIYGHIEQSLGAWEQRPVFKANIDSFIVLRKVKPRISLCNLRNITTFFPESDVVFPLDPSYEERDEGRTPDMPPSNPENVACFKVLQQMSRVGLVVPVNTEHMWNAAMESTGCKLTALGKHYHNRVERGLI